MGDLIPSYPANSSVSYELLKLNVPWEWNVHTSRLFQESKGWFCQSSRLIHFDPAKPLVLTSDAAPTGIRVVLSHLGENGDHHIGFVSKTLTAAEKNYSQLDCEALE
ncbi:hypothetical protein PR048_016148 [Dryococelus australis]|uniref:Reverse transcriptase/retrotransposon-derived protein RNase H-like domain-containing protein n=1 Tax=Dryococelus australis TaxID=614101 RepID=A0ABQ9HIX6_9NEOP|nr:hypothetical protein PR048_016148 [Dryococelus australis]